MKIRPGVWESSSVGSRLKIDSIRGKHLLGNYQTKVGKPDETKWFDVTGFTDGILIGFSVMWDDGTTNYSSITSWTGRYLSVGQQGFGDPARERIELLWNLQRKFRDSDEQTEAAFWESNLSNYSVLYYNKQ